MYIAVCPTSRTHPFCATLSRVKSQYHFIANTTSVHNRHINKKVMEFVKGKPKGTNPAIMGNPINMYAVNGSKNNLITRETTSKSIEPCTMQKNKAKIKARKTNYMWFK